MKKLKTLFPWNWAWGEERKSQQKWLLFLYGVLFEAFCFLSGYLTQTNNMLDGYRIISMLILSASVTVFFVIWAIIHKTPRMLCLNIIVVALGYFLFLGGFRMALNDPSWFMITFMCILMLKIPDGVVAVQKLQREEQINEILKKSNEMSDQNVQTG